MSWEAWLAVIAGWSVAEMLFLAYHLDRLLARVRRLEAERDLLTAARCRSRTGRCPYLYGCVGDCEWGRR